MARSAADHARLPPASPDARAITRRQLARLRWLTTVAPALAVFGYETLRHGLLEPLLPTTYGNLLVGLLALALAFGFSRVVFRVVERLQAQALASEREATALAAVVQERERLSRELHDGLAQLVSYLLVRLDTVQGLVSEGRRVQAIAELEQLRRVADDLYADVRESISGLRSRVAERGLGAALREYTAAFEERHGIAVQLDLDAPAGALPALVELELFRIVQEALANVRKHARARTASVRLALSRADTLELVIGDDGEGFDRAALAGARCFGLAGMRERAESLGGSFEIESQPGAGTRVTVRVPIEPAPCGERDESLARLAR